MRGRPRNLGAHGAEVRGVLLDMMRRKTAEEANSRLAAIVASSNDAIIGKTLDGVVTDWNWGAETILGYRADDIIGKSISVTLPPGHEEETAAILERIKRGERVEHFETRRRRKDGEIIDVSVTVSPVWDSSGRLLGASKVLRDITERQQTRQRLHDLQAELIHISRFTALGEMASMLAHELNQPLTAVANYLNGGRRLLEGGQTGSIPMVREALERAAEQALRAGQIIRRLREFVSRGESERRVENLVKLIEEASALALVGAKEAGVRMSFDFDTRVAFVLADKIQIQQVLHNLMRNAVEAMQETSPRELTVSTRKLDHETVGSRCVGYRRRHRARNCRTALSTLRNHQTAGDGRGVVDFADDRRVSRGASLGRAQYRRRNRVSVDPQDYRGEGDCRWRLMAWCI